MQPPQYPENEDARLKALTHCALLDSAPEERFDRITAMAKAVFDVPIVLISLVDKDRQWFKSRQGLTATETPRDISFCGHAILTPDQLFIVSNAPLDPRFSDNPLVRSAPQIGFYAGAPIKDAQGFALGTLCLIDNRPRQLSDSQQQLLWDFAALVEREIQYQDTQSLNQQLQQSTEQYASLVRNIPGVTYRRRNDKNWTMLYISEQIQALCGYSADQLIHAQPVNFAALIPHDYLSALTGQVQQAVASGQSWQLEYPVVTQSGQYRWLEDRARAVTDDSGEEVYIEGFLLDITRERQARDKLERHNQALKLLNRISFELRGSVSEVIEQALKLGCEFLQMDMAIVSEVLQNTYVVRWYYQPPGGGLEHGQHFDLLQTYCDITLKNRSLLAISHMGESQYCQHPCYQAFGLESYIAQPLNVDGKIFGTLNFSAATPRPQGFDEIDKLFVALLERWLGAKLERHQQRKMLNNLVEQVPGMIYQFRQWPDGHIAFPYTSSAIKDIYGVSAEAVKADAARVFERIFDEDLPRVSQSIEDSRAQLSVWNEQYRVLNQQGQPEWVEGRARPQRLEDGSTIWFGYIANIHQSKLIELSLESSEQRLRSLFELSPIGILLADYQTGQLLDCNAALLRPSGYSRQQLLSMNIMDLVPQSHIHLRSKILEQISSQDRFGPLEAKLRCHNTDSYPIRLQGVKIADQDQRTLVWCLIEDITEHKRVERMQKEFIAMVSHELRTPLTSIKGVLSLLAGGAIADMPEKAKSLLSTAYKNSQQLNDLINDILDLEKLSADAITFNMQALSVSAVLEEAKELYQHYGLKQGVTVSLIHPQEDYVVYADKKYLLQALANLLSNAIKFSPEQGVVTLSARRHQQHIRLQVEDQGEGIPDTFRERIFKRFAQADSSDNRKKGGTGLGLAITAELMVKMGGDVGFESEFGQGATFWLTLPAATDGVSD
ncbi:PAS domain S-box protein [Lacimicrobium sp. SS2-24]|uniref:PAS domain S-box protein n=1 Tax=Lacimicrobium sp. SS2-24 TaxID=2005569 RepID=UPI000B4AA586|nr:PAS domain S-box protein [Lacimicrobium sp. SS2-24]